MSKAFTRESDDLGPDEIAPVRAHPSSGARNYITRQGADRLRQRIEDLLETKRGQLTARSEAGKETNLRRIKFEIQKLQRTLNSVIVTDPPSDVGKVAFGASVLIRDTSGEEETYQIVGVDEAEPREGRISASSPLARALLHKQVGDKVRFQTPAGDRELTIIRVLY